MNDDYPTCNSSNILNYIFARATLLNYSKSGITDLTECPPNCVTYKYELTKFLPWSVNIGLPGRINSYKGGHIKVKWKISLVVAVKWINKEISVETEQLAYDSLTFVANFGGTLGLFVGFSFYTLWDIVLPLIEKCKMIFKV